MWLFEEPPMKRSASMQTQKGKTWSYDPNEAWRSGLES